MGRRALVLAAFPTITMKTITTSLFLLGLATGFACTSDVRAFCERLEECGENTSRNNVDDCVAKLEDLAPQIGFDPEACEAELAQANQAETCEAFGAQDLCSLCSPRFMSFLLSMRWNRCET